MPPEPRVADLRDEASALLRPLADLAAPVAPDSTPPWDQLVRIREHELDAAAGCAASLAFEGDFDGWRAAFARKRLGLAVLQRLAKGATADPTTIAADVLDQEVRTSTSSLASWLATLGSGGAAAVTREAAWFATATRRGIRSWPPPRGTTFGTRFAWDLPGRALRLEASADAVIWETRDVLVVVSGEDDGDGERRDLAWPALVAALDTGKLPASVTRLDLVSGERRRVPVTDDVLDTALTAAARAVEATMAVRFTAPPLTSPGRWCRRCRGRDVCPDVRV